MREVIRKCIVTQERLSKESMIRIVKKDGIITIDKDHSTKGRGAYIQRDKVLIEKARKRKTLSRVFKTNVDEEIYINLLGVINE